MHQFGTAKKSASKVLGTQIIVFFENIEGNCTLHKELWK